MKTLCLSLLLIIFVACNQQKSDNDSAERPVDKYLGYWQRDGKPGEVIRIFKKDSIYYTGDAEDDMPIEYDSLHNKFTFKVLRNGNNVEIMYVEKEKQLHWTILKAGQPTGEDIGKYNFLKK